MLDRSALRFFRTICFWWQLPEVFLRCWATASCVHNCGNASSHAFGRSFHARSPASIYITARACRRERPELGYPALNAVYLDDELSGQTISNNTFRNVYNGMMLGGGRDNMIAGNRFEQMGNLGITFDARGLGWQASSCYYKCVQPRLALA